MEGSKSTLFVFDRKLLEEREFWLKKLSSGIGETNLILDYPRPPTYRDEIGTVDITINDRDRQRLRQLTGDKDFLVYVVLMAALKVCMHKYSGNRTLVIGSPVRGEGEGDNVVPIVDYLKPKSSFRELLVDVRQSVLDAYKRQNYPFDRLIRDLGLEENRNRFSFFDVALVLTNIHCTLPKIRNDITIVFSKSDDKISGRVEFNLGLFDVTNVERFVGHFTNVLEQGLAKSDCLIDEMELLTQEERYQILVEWNDTHRTFSDDRCFHQLFEVQAAKNPDAIAAVFSDGLESKQTDGQLSYGELNYRSNQLARYMLAQGVKLEEIVGIFVERSLDVIVAIIGILKSGCAYLPLDPDYPQEHIEFMVKDAGVTRILTHECLKGKLESVLSQRPESSRPKLIVMDSQWTVISGESADNPVSGVTTENLAYVLYTSGTTGRPKGVLTCHLGLTNLAEAHARIFGLTPESRVIQLSTLNFDASVSEFGMSLSSGASLYFGPSESLYPGAGLVDQLEKNSITHITITPSALAVLPKRDLPSLKTIVVAGDVCSADVVKRWALGRRFFNAYGVTEASVCSLVSECKNAEGKPTLGRPIDNTQIYVLDRCLHPVPVGVPGELYIGGPCLARGYLNRPDLTNERFVVNPIVDVKSWTTPRGGSFHPVERLYRTGDKVRYSSSGEVEFLGRIDHQIKIRGYRIEPGEIEAVIEGHPHVRQGVVVEREDQPGQHRLAAYIVLDGDMGPGAEVRESKGKVCGSLGDYLRSKLPHFMIPSAFVVLDALPLSPNGKIDRKALPVPETVTDGDREGYVGPRDVLEMKLIQIWENLLKINGIGVCDNFFKLGGHSLLAVQLMARIEQGFDSKLPISTIFELPTIEKLVVPIREGRTLQSWSPLVMIKGGEVERPLFCVHPGGGTVVGYFDLARRMDTQVRIYGLQARGFEKGQKPVSELHKMAANYLEAIRTVQPEGPYFFVGWCLGARVSFEMALQLQRQGERVSDLIFLDAYAPSVIPDDLLELEDAAKMLALVAEDVPVSLDRLRSLGPDEMVMHVLEEAKKVNVVPPDLTFEDGRRFFEVFKANGRLAHWPISQVFQGRIVLFRADAELAFASRLTQSEDLGWGEYASSGVDVHFVPGNHNTLVREPHVKVLAEKLSRHFNEAREKM